ncbi:MAG: hypothetical protein CFE62_006870 [Candidatus Aquirickettsiella gammari]|uniref:J domain-containing protein n=1 Tax=Candidatus Aquirickettsiella gammari TaxID=2016198 RepID=A0A370CGZ0_9COXI|nr:MAG: hypothetical protein CFE62_006870 [Candidatus Aquirickettsiella gammari]
MLNSLLQGIEQRLAKKPFTWMSWWRGKKWISVFSIIPELEECPLWKRDEASLSSLRLFDLEPQALHTELQHYWKRPFWQRWWLSLFTSINNKRKAYAYYQRCLAFAVVQKQHHDTVSNLQYSAQERAILAELVDWVGENTRRCEEILEKHGGDLNWLQNYFPSVLSQYQKKRERVFLKLMEKRLKKITTKDGRTNLRSRVKKEYQKLGKVMRDYLLYPFPSEQARTNNDQATEQLGAVSDSRELVYVGPAVATRNTLGMYPSGKANLGDIDSVGGWVNSQREAIVGLLEEGRAEACIKIKALLEQSLNSIRMVIEPQITGYQQLINDAKQGRVEYEIAIEWSEDLQPRLIKFFRSSALLFHPDKSDRNEELRRLQTELFKEFNQLAENSRETLRQGLQTLKNCIPKLESKYQDILDKMQRDRENSKARSEELIRAQAQKQAQAQATMDAMLTQKYTAIHASIAEIEEKIERLNNLLIENGMMNQNAMPEERPETSTYFFTRPAP